MSFPQNPEINRKNNTLVSNYSSGNQWFYNNHIILPQTDPVIIPDLEGDYYVQVTDSNGCKSEFSEKIYWKFNSISFENEYKDISIYPNPISENLNISFDDNLKIPQKIQIINILSDIVWSHEIDLKIKTLKIDLSELINGFYIIRIYYKEKNSIL